MAVDHEEGVFACVLRQSGEDFHIRCVTGQPPSRRGEAASFHRAAQDRVVGMRPDLHHQALWHFQAIVMWPPGHRQHLFDRLSMPTRPTVDPLKAEITVDHQQPAAPARPVADRLELIGRRPAVQSHSLRQQQRIGANIGEDDLAVFGERLRREGKALGHPMRNM